MPKEKLGIVSSYDDFCGNASYTRALSERLKKDYDTTVVSLNVECLRRGNSKSGSAHIQEIRNQLKTFDCVNIQFEAGLFGSDMKLVQKRFFTLAKACKKLVLTMHRLDAKVKYPGMATLGRMILRGKMKAFLKALKHSYANNKRASLFRKVIEFCKRRSIPIIVHTQRDRKLIGILFNYNQVFDHPLCFYDQDHITAIDKSCSRSDFCRSLCLDEDKKYIGVFGFINEYKGHETLIKALEFLPENYELLIVGAQHPHTIQVNEPVDRYIERLLKLIEAMNLVHRVKFYRLVNDEDFVKTLLGCDFNVLPYLEVGQGGSAIAALSLETNSRAVFSQNFAFFELAKYAQNSFKMFSIGNYLELAQAILSYEKSHFIPHLEEYHKKYNIHTSAALYQKLLSSEGRVL